MVLPFSFIKNYNKFFPLPFSALVGFPADLGLLSDLDLDPPGAELVPGVGSPDQDRFRPRFVSHVVGFLTYSVACSLR